MVAGGLQLVGGERRARAENPHQCAPDELPRLGRLLLVADGDLPAGGEELRHVGVQRMERNAGHRRVLAFGQREAEEARSVRCVLMKHLEEIAEPEEQQRAGRQTAFDLEILLHHRGLALGGHGWGRGKVRVKVRVGGE